jgi:O-6-methylguanine DNA methyltransferase
VWKALLDIPYGQTVSYGDIAKKIGKPKAVRAVGGANSRNPIPVIAACHRVIGSSGTLVGYAGGMDRKVKLLALEAKKNLPKK